MNDEDSDWPTRLSNGISDGVFIAGCLNVGLAATVFGLLFPPV